VHDKRATTEQPTPPADPAAHARLSLAPVAMEAACAGERLQLGSLIAAINAFNRLNVMVRQPTGSYRPGQFAGAD
jgi:hypothetical protein